MPATVDTRLAAVLAKIDAANEQDPHTELHLNRQVPREWLYGRRMSETLTEFSPLASDALQIAVRGQHIERWTSPRDRYPEGRTGYKQWRAELGLYHAKRVVELMAEAGYSPEEQARVRYLIQKRGLKRDPESQVLEDVACLVFLKHYLADFAAKHERGKLIDIIQKTWAKMSAEGHAAALQIPLTEPLSELVHAALNEA